MSRTLEVFTRFLRLGCTSFGGPVAHLAYFRREFVDRTRWLDTATFAEIVALCSVLPGPTSSQVGMLIGARRAGPAGGLLAWFAFTLPSALILGTLGISLHAAATNGALDLAGGRTYAGALEGLGAAAAAVVLVAVIQLGRALLGTNFARAVAAGALALALAVDHYAAPYQWVVLLAGALAGFARDAGGASLPEGPPLLPWPRRTAVTAAAIFAFLLLGLPIVAPPDSYLSLFATFFRAGALVFGGGHVVLTFLTSEVAEGRLSAAAFFAGYGATQAVPGPIFTFAAFLGGADRQLGGVVGALVAVLGIFAPSFLLLTAVVPLWSTLRHLPRAASTLAGMNAAVVGMLGAVFIDPLATSLVRHPLAVALGLVALALLQFARLPAWVVVLACALAGAAARTLLRFPM